MHRWTHFSYAYIKIIIEPCEVHMPKFTHATNLPDLKIRNLHPIFLLIRTSSRHTIRIHSLIALPITGFPLRMHSFHTYIFDFIINIYLLVFKVIWHSIYSFSFLLNIQLFKFNLFYLSHWLNWYWFFWRFFGWLRTLF